MLNIGKLISKSAVDGVELYVMEKVTEAVGQLAVNFLPAAIPTAGGMLLGGLAVAAGLEQFGRGKMMAQLGEYAGALSVVNALRNTSAIDNQVEKLTAQVATIGMTPTAKAAYLAAIPTAGYMPSRTSQGYLPKSSAGYAPARSMGLATRGGNRFGMRGLTSVHSMI